MDGASDPRATADLGRVAAEALTDVRPLTVAAVPGSATVLTPVATSNETIATGPTASCREVPKSPYSSKGKSDE